MTARRQKNNAMLRDVKESFRSQPGRVGLSFLAVMVGIVVLTLLLSILFGLRNESRELVKRFGANVAILLPDSKLIMHRGYRGLEVLSDVVSQNMDDEQTGTMIRLNERFSEDYQTFVRAADLSIPSLRRWELKEGRFFDQTDKERASRVVLITETTARRSRIRMGSECRIGPHTFQVIGILKDGSDIPITEGMKAAAPEDAVAYVLLTTAEQLKMKHDIHSAGIFITARENESIDQAIVRYDQIFQNPALSNWDMRWVTANSMIEDIRALQRVISLTAGSVALLCLLLGGTTLMSLMLADVRQRIPEIGLRRSIGASRRDVAALFVVESCFITCAAAVAGILLASIMLVSLSGRIDLPLSLQSFTFVIPVIVSIVLGCAFSFWPARVAAGLSPAQALRNA